MKIQHPANMFQPFQLFIVMLGHPRMHATKCLIVYHFRLFVTIVLLENYIAVARQQGIHTTPVA